MILHQDYVGEPEIFSGNKWLAVPPQKDAFGINIGDTSMIQKLLKRRSLVYLVIPNEDTVVRSPEDIVVGSSRLYPDFSWSYQLDFTNNHRRADLRTLKLLPMSPPFSTLVPLLN
ncbi:hypothetical protein F3Y22_tig00110940pilonHSYRG00112 [Hibiscus syriacus]|uniref:Uncharacterized protein n=1 Tax=Hibiscus syriacus TaxID=106335 RepID=A0A6A2ZBS3_HIBSY|nr:hypothetical protein F3Y22_tig00110940pilonHSYRG00112 [Hibiscus syriacus]